MTNDKKQQERRKLRAILILIIPMTLVSFIGCKGDGGNAQASSISEGAPNIGEPQIGDIADIKEDDILNVEEDVLDQISKVEEEEIRDAIQKEVEQAEEGQEAAEDEASSKDQDSKQDVAENDFNEENQEDDNLSQKGHRDIIKKLRKRYRKLKLRKLFIKAHIQLRVLKFKKVKADLKELRGERKALHDLVKELRGRRKSLPRVERLALNKEIQDIKDLEIKPLSRKIEKKKRVKNRLKKKVKSFRKKVKKMNKKLKRLRKRIQRHKNQIANEG